MGTLQPLIASSLLRIDVAGVPTLDGLSFQSTGEWVLVVGAPRALFDVAAGFRATARGKLTVGGKLAHQSLREGATAAAPLDPPMPPRWSAREYITWSARLFGLSKDDARAEARHAIARLRLEAMAETRLGPAPPIVRRSAVLGAALVTGAPIVLVEDPVVGLAPETARSFGRTVVHALGDRRVVFFASRVPLDSPATLAAEEAILIDGSRVLAQGAPAEIAAAERSFGLRVAGRVTAFSEALEAELAAHGGRVLTRPGPSEGGHAYFTVNLGGLRTKELLRIATSTEAVVIELRPIVGAFA